MSDAHTSWLKGLRQCSPFITLDLGPMEMDRVIYSESCYKWTILQRYYRKMTIPLIPEVKFHGNKFGSHSPAKLCSRTVLEPLEMF